MRIGLVRLSAAAIAGAALVHLWHAGSHSGTLAWFFLATGAAQVALAAGILFRPTSLALPALTVNSALLLLFLFTRLPFLPAAEPVETAGLAAKALEILSIALILAGLRAPRAVSASPHAPLLSRRSLITAGSIGLAGAATGALGRIALAGDNPHRHRLAQEFEGAHFHLGNVAVGQVDTSRFDPMAFLRDFDYGEVSRDSSGRTVRDYYLSAVDLEIEVAPGVWFPAWAYTSRTSRHALVPGPTLRAEEGDLVRVHFTNAGAHPHTIHFHGFHPAEMDGVFELVHQGENFTYEFAAEPFGMHLYHCHTPPLKKHIHKGLYGAFIVDPPGGRPPADEMVMVMNGFDTDFDGENEIYAVNTVAHYYMHNPIRIRVDELVRIYCVNITEFDLMNSFHSHATFFHEYRTGTKLTPDNFTDTIILGQGERSILELRYRWPGLYMFHAHVSEFAELGWSGMFEVVP